MSNLTITPIEVDKDKIENIYKCIDNKIIISILKQIVIKFTLDGRYPKD